MDTLSAQQERMERETILYRLQMHRELFLRYSNRSTLDKEGVSLDTLRNALSRYNAYKSTIINSNYFHDLCDETLLTMKHCNKLYDVICGIGKERSESLNPVPRSAEIRDNP